MRIGPVVFAFACALLAGCLGSPEPPSCADDPTLPGCRADRGPEDAGPADRGPEDAAPADRGPEDTGPEDHALRDRGPEDTGPEDEGPRDRGPDPDQGPADPCAGDPCPAPPIEGSCFETNRLSIGDPRCLPSACPPDDPACDPVALECSAYIGCVMRCFFLPGAGVDEDCFSTCEARATPAALERSDAVDACGDAAGCPDGVERIACLRTHCPAEIAACSGDADLVWFARPELAERPYTCDYPLTYEEACGERNLTCRQGACADPCDPDPCPVLERSCAGNNVVRPISECVAADGIPECIVAEERMACPDGEVCNAGRCIRPNCRPVCENRVIVTCDDAGVEVRVRCLRDEQCLGGACQPFPEVYGNACRTQEDTRACTDAGLRCRGFAIVPMCLYGDEPGATGDPCWTAQDCRLEMICTRQGTCSPGEPGDPCTDDLDCQASCLRGRCQ